MKRSILILTLLASTQANAQIRHMFDTIRHDARKSRAFFLSLDGKNSVVSDMPIKMFGLQAGYLYNKRTNFYIGYYASYNNSNRVIVVENPTAGSGKRDTNTVLKTYEFAYFNFGCEYYFHNSRKWRFSFPAGIGIGIGSDRLYRETQPEQKVVSNKVSFIMPIEVGFNANYKLTWWLWAGAGIGQRVCLFSSKYNGPFYTIGLSLKFGEIYRRTKKLLKRE